ncbi:hypothetical protein [Haloglycomyces albus]|uniref:hypothetical protein n=1 Tax=Haloglycomyces albus TaxID=526067 RepID=UPI00046D5FD1|nr:hypothetical protein [Haloglycomyces albus]
MFWIVSMIQVLLILTATVVGAFRPKGTKLERRLGWYLLDEKYVLTPLIAILATGLFLDISDLDVNIVLISGIVASGVAGSSATFVLNPNYHDSDIGVHRPATIAGMAISAALAVSTIVLI